MTLPSYGQPIARLDIGLDALDGVVIAAPAGGDILVYDGVDTWRNRTVTGDITISSTGVVAIAAGVIVDADISATAEIAVSKLADGAARQILQTDAAGTGVEWTSNMDGVTIGAATPAPGTFNTLTKTGTTGLTWTNVSDEDYEIFFLSGVTGGPRWIWDEAGDRWSSNFGIIITSGSLNLNNQGSILNVALAGNDWDGTSFRTAVNVFVANGVGVVIGHTAQVTVDSLVAEFQVLGTATADSAIVVGKWGDDGNPARIYIHKSRGASIGSNGALESGDLIGQLHYSGNDGTDDNNVGALLRGAATENWSNTAHGTMLIFVTTDNTTTVNDVRMTIDEDGGLFMAGATGGSQGVGTGNFTAAYDDGVILTTDYIFDLYFDRKVLQRDIQYANTWLPSVRETYDFVSAHRHLPWIAGREEWEANGRLSLGQVQRRLWEGQEQQQLHIFEHENRLTAIEADGWLRDRVQEAMQDEEFKSWLRGELAEV